VNPARRSLRNTTLPQAWRCLPQLYNDGLRCQVNCGAWDPDCRNASLPVVLPSPDVAPPAGWICPPFYYNASDGCDAHCGVEDPDCSDSCSDSFSWQPAATFTYAAEKMAEGHVRNHSLYQHPELSVSATNSFSLQPGQPTAGGDDTSSSSHGLSTGGLIGVGCVVVAGVVLLATLGLGLHQQRRERREATSSDTLSASLLAHVDQDAV
jgi:hypothetical protein